MRDEGDRDRCHTSNQRYAVEKTDQDLCSSSRMRCDGFCPTEDEGLKDEETEEFLHARAKRGRGAAVGSRMDETGPYMTLESNQYQTRSEANFRERWESRVLGPEKPLFVQRSESSDEELYSEQGECKKSKTSHSSKRVSRHSKKHKSKEELKAKSRKKREKRSERRE